MIVLALDTALAACSVALYDTQSDQILAARVQDITRGHAELLPGMIEAVTTECNLAMASLDRIVVTRGPGTFTGVRIGLATARGLALALHRPVCGITTLEALAAAVISSTNTACVTSVVDARRGEVYVQNFAPDGSALDEARLVTTELAVRQVPLGAVLVGTGTAVLRAAGCDGLPAPVPSLPDATVFVRRAVQLRPEEAPAEPLYLRAPDAKPQAPVVTALQAPILVSDVGPAHAAILAGLHASAFARAWSAAEIASLLSTPGASALLAVMGECEREPVGFVLTRTVGAEAELLTICTRPAGRRRGVARRLMSSLLGRLAQQGVTSLFLEVGVGNPSALSLYQSLGFAQVGRRSGYYRVHEGNGGDALVMRRQLQAA